MKANTIKGKLDIHLTNLQYKLREKRGEEAKPTFHNLVSYFSTASTKHSTHFLFTQKLSHVPYVSQGSQQPRLVFCHSGSLFGLFLLLQVSVADQLPDWKGKITLQFEWTDARCRQTYEEHQQGPVLSVCSN